jgi:hypothetical protein
VNGVGKHAVDRAENDKDMMRWCRYTCDGKALRKLGVEKVKRQSRSAMQKGVSAREGRNCAG